MITGLTKAQKEAMPRYGKKWTDIGLSCEPLDVDSAKNAICRAYQVAGIHPPSRFIICDSPLSGAVADFLLRSSVGSSVWESVRSSVWDSVWSSVWSSVGESVGESVWDSMWDSVGSSVGDSVGSSVGDSVWDSVWDSVGSSVRSSVWDSVWSSVGSSVWESVRDSVWDSVGDSVWDSVWDSVRDSVRSSVGESVWESVWDSVRSSVGDSVYGSHDAGWLCIYDYYLSELHIAECEKLIPLMDIAKSCGWWIPRADACILQHRHCEQHRDERGRLHNPHGMAVKYRDGWGVYAYHGVRIPIDKGWIIDDPNRLSIAAIDGEDNAEIRRVMLELFGHDRYIMESGSTPIHADEYGELFRRNFSGDEPLCMVRVTNSTPEVDGTFGKYLLRVPPSIQTAREAVAWTFALDSAEYQPQQES